MNNYTEDYGIEFEKKVTKDYELGAIQLLSNQVLAAVAQGKLDLNQVALENLAARGLDKNGNWVGFSEAKKLHNVNQEKK